MSSPADAWLQWSPHAHVLARSTLRRGTGVSVAPFDDFNLGLRCGDRPDAVGRNRDLLVEQLGLPSQPRWLRQVHGTAVANFSDPASTIESEADAAITSAPGVVLAILTADCMPVLFCSQDGDEVGAAHAGWRGLASGVLEATIAAMRTPPHRLLAWLGPAAGPFAYEVGEEVRATFVDGDANAASAFAATRPGHWLCDLYALARMRLVRAGVEQLFGGGLCTISDPQRFYSHRRDGITGRMATLIWRL